MGRFATPCSSPIDIADEAFRAMCDGPDALALDGAAFSPELPARRIRLDVLLAFLLDGSSFAVRDAVWAAIVGRARHDERWKLAAVGMAIPALRRAANRHACGFEGDVEELDAEVLAGFLGHLSVVDVELPGIMNKLRWAAWRGGHEYVQAHCRVQDVEKATAESAGLVRPAGHPDLVLSRAVDAGVISESDAELICATRLDGEDMAAFAERSGLSYNAVKIRRQRAEQRLAAFLTDAPRPRADQARVRVIRPARRPGLVRSAEALLAA